MECIVSIPQNIPYRVPRPKCPIFFGGFIDTHYEEKPTPFAIALMQGFRLFRCELIQLYRKGPYSVSALFSIEGVAGTWTVSSDAPFSPEWDADGLEDWMYGDLVFVQLPQKLAIVSPRHIPFYL